MRYEQNIDIAKVGKIHKLSRLYQIRKARALAVIEAAAAKSERPYLALSGGKDSVALLALCHEVFGDRELVLWAHVSDASFPGTVETIQASAGKVGRPVVIDESPVSAFDVIGKQSQQKFGKTGFFFDSIAEFEKDYDLVFTGVRAAESKRRMAAYRAHGHTFSSRNGIRRCDGIAHFSIGDVAAAIVEYDMPVHPIYSKIALSPLPVRLGYATALDLVEKGTVLFLKINYPDLFIRLCNAWPKAREYV